MREATVSSLGLEPKVQVPSTVDEYNALDKGRANACLEDAISHNLYHVWLSDWRAEFLKAVLEETKVPWLTQTVKRGDKEVTEVTETEKEYFNRVLLKLGKVPSAFEALAQRVAKTIKFDPSAHVRVSAPRAPSNKMINKANALIAARDIKWAARKLASLVGHPVAEDVTAIATAMTEYESQVRAKAQADAAAALR
jgi:hypothetical protein